jgi:hypothetical protein
MFDWHKILEQLAVVMTVPGPFVVAVLIVGGLIWLAVNWSYNSVIASKNGQIELLDRQVADYKSKLQGASPDEAKARIDALEARLKLIEPRRLAGEPRRKFASILSAEPKSSIAIISEASGDNLQLAADFAAVFRSRIG